MNILIAEDNAINRKILAAILEVEGFLVFSAINGLEAMEILEREPVDVVISDILMPGMDGYQLCRMIRAEARFSTLPIILYSSTFDSPGEERLARQIGADRFVQKPAPVDVLLKTIYDVTSDPNSQFPRDIRITEEQVVMKEYNAALVAKLEEKNLKVENALTQVMNANRELLEKARQIQELNETLEQRVLERTSELQDALENIKTLAGLLPICSCCKKIRDGQGYWHQVEAYMMDHSEATFTHSVCDDCGVRLYGKEFLKLKNSGG